MFSGPGWSCTPRKRHEKPVPSGIGGVTHSPRSCPQATTRPAHGAGHHPGSCHPPTRGVPVIIWTTSTGDASSADTRAPGRHRSHRLRPRALGTPATPHRGRRGRHYPRRRRRGLRQPRHRPRRDLQPRGHHPCPAPGPRPPRHHHQRRRTRAHRHNRTRPRVGPVATAGGPPIEPTSGRRCAAPCGRGHRSPFPAGALSVARARPCAPPARCALPAAEPACGGCCGPHPGPSFRLTQRGRGRLGSDRTDRLDFRCPTDITPVSPSHPRSTPCPERPPSPSSAT